jgi:phosphoribosylamine--glycine ligase
LDIQNPQEVLSFLKKEYIGFTVIGPEVPLVDGLADVLRKAGNPVFGPGRAAAQLEGSKVFAKNFMKTYGLPTADFQTFSSGEEALAFVQSSQWSPALRVVKASGLAAGKGVIVCKDKNEVLKSLEDILIRKVFGLAGNQVILEEVLEGQELSVMALCDGKVLKSLVTTQDHKRVFDSDQGPNTGGMGAYGPVPWVTDALWKQVEERVFDPFLKGLKTEKLDYRGVIYFGLMVTSRGLFVLEFNVRFGDPETQVILPLIENDWLDLFQATASGSLSAVEIKRRSGSALVVVMTAKGYPGSYEKGRPIQGLDTVSSQKDVLVFHSGTSRQNGQWVTSGGRVLGVTALGSDLKAARARAYEALRSLHFDGAHFRQDIGGK